MARVAVVRYESHAIRDVLAGRQELTGGSNLAADWEMQCERTSVAVGVQEQQEIKDKRGGIAPSFRPLRLSADASRC